MTPDGFSYRYVNGYTQFLINAFFPPNKCLNLSDKILAIFLSKLSPFLFELLPILCLLIKGNYFLLSWTIGYLCIYLFIVFCVKEISFCVKETHLLSHISICIILFELVIISVNSLDSITFCLVFTIMSSLLR